MTSSEVACRMMELWLTWALRQPRDAFPRIPLRPVSDGGFAGLTARPEGRRAASRWWEEATDRIDADPPFWG